MIFVYSKFFIYGKKYLFVVIEHSNRESDTLNVERKPVGDGLN